MFSKWGERRRVLEIEALLHEIQRQQRGFHILAGDFNSLAPGELLQTTKLPRWIRAMVWVSGRDLQRDTVKLIQEHSYSDAFRKLHPDDKGYTFPTNDAHVRLDYVFIPQEFSDHLIECKIIDQPPATAASDHFPILSRFNIP
jgi:exodeoxyribonuclease-3